MARLQTQILVVALLAACAAAQAPNGSNSLTDVRNLTVGFYVDELSYTSGSVVASASTIKLGLTKDGKAVSATASLAPGASLLNVSDSSPDVSVIFAGAGCVNYSVVAADAGFTTVLADFETLYAGKADTAALPGSLCSGNCSRLLALDPNGHYLFVALYNSSDVSTASVSSAFYPGSLRYQFFEASSPVCKGLTTKAPAANTTLYSAVYNGTVGVLPVRPPASIVASPEIAITNVTCLSAALVAQGAQYAVYVVTETDLLAFANDDLATTPKTTTTCGLAVDTMPTFCRVELTGLDPKQRYYIVTRNAGTKTPFGLLYYYGYAAADCDAAASITLNAGAATDFKGAIFSS